MWTTRFAPAKVNLFLHVGPVADDGYHPVCSLMVFADVGDTVRLRDHAEMSFRVEGPFAQALGAGTLGAGGEAPEPDNLVTRARDRLIEGLPSPPAPFELVLDKRLPVAAGLGGGSADAAAALVLISERLAAAGETDAADPARLAAIARTLGADVTACIASRSVIGRGRGDEISPAPALPVLDAVLVNPLAPSSTGAVYRAFDAIAAGPGADEPPSADELGGAAAVAAFLRTTRNDLEGPAVALQPRIAEVLAALAAAPQTLFHRMSGSGATCFALVEKAESARALAARLLGDHPGWWVRPCRLGAADLAR